MRGSTASRRTSKDDVTGDAAREPLLGLSVVASGAVIVVTAAPCRARGRNPIRVGGSDDQGLLRSRRVVVSGGVASVVLGESDDSDETRTIAPLLGGHLRADTTKDAEVPLLVLDVTEQRVDQTLLCPE